MRVGSLLPEITAPTPIELPNGTTLTLEPLVRRRPARPRRLQPCTILLNNDLTAGVPELLKGLDSQFVLPPLHAGWATRRKSNHFSAYEQVATEFGPMLGIDPGASTPLLGLSQREFHERQGECLAANVDAVLGMIRDKYREYGIDETPFVIVKADAGTYGMGVMTVKDASKSPG